MTSYVDRLLSIQHRAITAEDRGRNVEVYGPITEGSAYDPVDFAHVSHADHEEPVRMEEGVDVPWAACVRIVAPVMHELGDGVDRYAIDLANPHWVEASPSDDFESPSYCE